MAPSPDGRATVVLAGGSWPFSTQATRAPKAEFYGPGGRFGLTGPPILTRLAPVVRDRALQRRIWDASERLTGVRYRFPDRG